MLLAVALVVNPVIPAPDVPEAGRGFALQLHLQHIQMTVPAARYAQCIAAIGHLGVGQRYRRTMSPSGSSANSTSGVLSGCLVSPKV